MINSYFFINVLTISRILFAIIIYYLLSTDGNHILALILFFAAGLSDYFDGYLSRKYQKTSKLGEILDPIADKILLIFVFFGLSISLSSYLIGFMGSIIISREIWVSALRDFNSRNNNLAATKVTYLAKVKTSIQFLTIFVYLIGLASSIMLLIIIADILLIISTLITLYTGYNYSLNTFNN